MMNFIKKYKYIKKIYTFIKLKNKILFFFLKKRIGVAVGWAAAP
jgi:hypothetical protein